MTLPRPRMALIGAGAALAVATGVAIPVAALAGSSPVTYYACVTTKTGALKIVYDLLLLAMFRKIRPPEELP